MSGKELPEGKMYMTTWVKEQIDTLEKLVLSVDRKVNKLLARHEEAKKEHASKVDVLELDITDIKTSVNVILDGLKK